MQHSRAPRSNLLLHKRPPLQPLFPTPRLPRPAARRPPARGPAARGPARATLGVSGALELQRLLQYRLLPARLRPRRRRQMRDNSNKIHGCHQAFHGSNYGA